MGWISQSIIPLAVVCLIAFVVSFLPFLTKAYRWALRGVSLLALVAALGGFAYVACSAPGGEDTVDQGDRPAPTPTPAPINPLEPLRNSWDSEASADWPVAELLALMCETTYLPPVDAEPALSKLGFTKTTTILDSSMAGYVATADDVAVVVFRGTDNNIDWIVNLGIGSVQTPKGSIHKGFYDAYQPLKPQVVKILKASKPKHLWITGHSLGGALAVVCAQDLIENEELELDGIITFGQPMVAKRPLAQHLGLTLRGRYAHYVNGNDLVARVPPNFFHFGSLVWFTESGVKRSKVKIKAFGVAGIDEPPEVEDEEITPLTEREFEQLKKNLRGAEFRAERFPEDKGNIEDDLPWIRDHGMEFYLEKIRKATNKAVPK